MMMDPFTHCWPVGHLLPKAHPRHSWCRHCHWCGHRRPIGHALIECLLLPLPLHIPVSDDLRHHRNPHLHLLLWHHSLLHHRRGGCCHCWCRHCGHHWPVGHALTECL